LTINVQFDEGVHNHCNSIGCEGHGERYAVAKWATEARKNTVAKWATEDQKAAE
jgi:hypothetical protein